MRNEPMTVRDLMSYLLQNCDLDTMVLVSEEGIMVNLYEDDIFVDDYGNVNL